MLLGLLPGVASAALPPGGTFVDDNGSVHEGAIEAIYAAGITVGCNPPDNTNFCPEDPVTRGQMAAFLGRALGLTPSGGDTFDDDDDSVFEGNIEALAASGITRGCNPPGNTRFCPDDSVTRGQMAAFLVRAFGYTEGEGGDLFGDDDSSVFEADIDRLATAGVTKGCDPPANSRYCPDAPVSRAEMATFLTRALDLEPITPPPPAGSDFSCDEIVGLGVEEIDGNAAYSHVGPGDVLCLQAGTRGEIEIVNLHGTAADPIIIVNTGGVVTLDVAGTYSGIDIAESDHIRVSGAGVTSACGAEYSESAQACGIRVIGSDRAVTAKTRAEYIEIDHIEMGEILDGTAVSIKDDSMGRGEWVLHGVVAHHNYLHEIGDEGMYIGSSDYETGEFHVLEGVHIHHNLVVDTGRDGLQVGSTTADCSIHHNVIKVPGQNDESSHRAGVMNNKGSVCDIYSNTVIDAAGWGIYVQGNGTNRVFNNVIIRSGRLVSDGDSDGDGIAIHDGSNTSKSIYVWNNTIIDARGDGIGFHNDVGPDNQIINNIVVGSGGESINADTGDEVSNNLTASSVGVIGFVDAGFDDYRLSSSSAAVDGGKDLRSSGVTDDRVGAARPRGAGFDIGAYESY